jgi:tetratricopeptide (TPR) repeat protein
MESKKLQIFNYLSFYSLIVTIFLSLFFFIPYVSIPLEVSKGFLISIGIVVSVFFWLMARLVDGKFVIPSDRMILFGALIPLTFLVSSFFSSSIYLSLFGRGFEVGTFGMILVCFLSFFLSSIYFQEENKIHKFFKAILLGTAIMAIFQLIQLFIGFEKITPGMFSGVLNGNLIGTWDNFAFLFGGIVILILSILEFVPQSRRNRILLSIFGIVALFLLALVNIFFVWVLIGVFSLIIFIYSISQNRNEDRTLKNFPFLSFFTVIVSLLFIVGNSALSTIITSYFGSIAPEAYPSVSGTAKLFLPALRDNVFFGTGPNTFALDWSLWRPLEVLQTPFWNVDFQSGFALIPTFLITTGLVGIIAWLLFIIIFIFRALQSMFLVMRKPQYSYSVIISILLAVYLWIGAFVSNLNATLLMLAFCVTGVLLGSLVSIRVLPVYEKSFLEDPRTSFFSILGLVLLMILSISTIYAYSEKFSGAVYYSTSSPKDTTRESLVKSESKILKSISLDKNDTYYRGLSQIYMAEVQTIVSDKTLSQDTMKSATQDRITNIESAISSAIKQNPKYYANWLNAGNMYTSLLSLGVTGSYENAVGAYAEALKFSPSNPGVILAQAQLELVNKDIDKAKSFIEQALTVKANYIDAIFTRAQIKYDAGDKVGAIADAELAAKYAPRDATVFFKLGSLKYNTADYNGAISAFEMAVRLDNYYHNARYLLGLSYKKAGRADDAHTQFGILHNIFPDNQEITNAFNGNAEIAPAPAVSEPDQIKKTNTKTKELPTLPKQNP